MGHSVEDSDATRAVVVSALAATVALRRRADPPSDEELVRAVLDAAAHHRRPERAERVLAAAERMLERLSPYPSRVFAGLVPRRRVGDTQAAIAAYQETLAAIHELRTVVERSRPLYLTTGGN